jgi:penicillin G amidase
MLQLLFFLLMPIISFANEFECKTQYNPLGIPLVTVQSEDEALFCFGLHHGRDRAWQMDFFRRVAQGKTAEIFGFSHLKSDLMMRLLNLPEKARALWEEFPEEKKRLLNMYSAGVNKGFLIGKYAFEFTDRSYAPEKWKPEDSLTVILLQSFDQTRKTFFRDYEEELQKQKWGDKSADLFSDDNLPWNNTILKVGEYEKRQKIVQEQSSKTLFVKLWDHFPRLFGEETGSNNWVVDRRKSSSGKAILANDPHLDLKTPLFWYWLSISSPDTRFIGASVPGFPFIASGTNGEVAWGLTNSYLKAADVISLSDLSSDLVETIRPLVWVRWWIFKIPFFFKSFKKLRTGHPLLPLELKEEKNLVLRWTGFKLTAQDVSPFFDLLKVKSIDEADDILSQIGVPSWNFVFADRKGEIGYRTIGKTFKNTAKLSFGITNMSLKDFEKESYLSSQEMPHLLRPRRSYLHTANNRHWPSDAKFYGGRAYSSSYRGHRIEELLSGTQDVETTKLIQCDRKVVDAPFFVPKLLKYVPLPELENWDFIAKDDSKALPLYRRFMDLLLEKWQVTEHALYRLLDNLSKEQEQELTELLSTARTEVQERSWAQIHRVSFSHLSKNDLWVFSPEVPGVGDNHSVDPGTAKWNPERKLYEQNSGASMRVIIEMDENPRILLSLPGVNREYTRKKGAGVWEGWRACQYSEIKF